RALRGARGVRSLPRRRHGHGLQVRGFRSPGALELSGGRSVSQRRPARAARTLQRSLRQEPSATYGGDLMQYELPPNRTAEVSMMGVERVLGPDGRADPAHDPGLATDLVVRIYEGMLRTRLIDERMLMLQRQGRIGFHVGCRGEEACIVAAAAALRDQDWIFPCYREMGALFWRGFPLQTY